VLTLAKFFFFLLFFVTTKMGWIRCFWLSTVKLYLWIIGY
jgi:hypothetical protein